MRKLKLLAILSVFIVPTLALPIGDVSKLSDQELVYVLQSSPSIPNKVAAIRALGMRRYTPAAPALIQLCYDRNREIRTASIIALGMMQARDAQSAFYTIVWDRSNTFTVWDKMSAVWALGNIPETNVQSLISILQLHPDFKVRLQAARSLQYRPELEARMAVYFWQPILSKLP